MSNNEPLKYQNLKVVKHWTNGFAESCYELENGTTLYISYHGDSIRIESPEKIGELTVEGDN